MARSNFFNLVNDQLDKDEPRIIAVIDGHPLAVDSLFPILVEGVKTKSATDPEPPMEDPAQMETSTDSTDSSESHLPRGFMYTVVLVAILDDEGTVKGETEQAKAQRI